MTAERLIPSGAWQLSALIDGYLVSKVYYEYTRREAQRMFRAEYLSKSSGLLEQE